MSHADSLLDPYTVADGDTIRFERDWSASESVPDSISHMAE